MPGGLTTQTVRNNGLGLGAFGVGGTTSVNCLVPPCPGSSTNNLGWPFTGVTQKKEVKPEKKGKSNKRIWWILGISITILGVLIYKLKK